MREWDVILSAKERRRWSLTGFTTAFTNLPPTPANWCPSLLHHHDSLHPFTNCIIVISFCWSVYALLSSTTDDSTSTNLVPLGEFSVAYDYGVPVSPSLNASPDLFWEDGHTFDHHNRASSTKATSLAVRTQKCWLHNCWTCPGTAAVETGYELLSWFKDYDMRLLSWEDSLREICWPLMRSFHTLNHRSCPVPSMCFMSGPSGSHQAADVMDGSCTSQYVYGQWTCSSKFFSTYFAVNLCLHMNTLVTTISIRGVTMNSVNSLIITIL